MKALDVDFVDRSRRWLAAAVAALLLAAGVAAGAGWRAWQQWHSLEREQVLNAQLRARLQSLRASQAAAAPAADPYARQDAELSRLAGFDLSGAFASIESAQVAGVKVTAIELAPADAQAHVQIEADGLVAALDYVDALNSGLPVPVWRLARVDGTTGGVKAQVDARWNMAPAR